MSSDNTPAAAASTETEKKQLELNLVELINLSCNVLHQMFLATSEQKAKEQFKTIKQGKNIKTGTVTIGEALTAQLKLALDYSEFKGPGFNFDLFMLALRGMLQRISTQLKAKANLNLLNSDSGSFLVNLPGAVQYKDQVNILVMSLDLATAGEFTLRLMFLDPEQFVTKPE